jgi:heavy metal translocating P-type ATPase
VIHTAEADEGEASLCDHCGLPVPGPWWSASRRTDLAEPAYCCFGCRLAAAISRESGDAGASRRTLARLGLAVFFTMNVMAFTMALWASDMYRSDGNASALSVALEGLFRYIVMIFAIPVLILLGRPILENALAGLWRGVFSTDLLLSAGVLAAFAYSAVSVFRGEGPIYFEVGCVVLAVVTLGRWIEATGKQRANDALDRLARLMPEQVRRVRDGSEEQVAFDQIRDGDLLRVLGGERIPADGVVVRGIAFVDDHCLTGESEAVTRQAGDAVLGGSTNLDGELFVEVTAAGPAGTLARMIEMVRRARLAKGHYERLADRISSWFVPIVAAIAVVSFVVVGLHSGWDRGLLRGLAVVLIACPCALGLATPLAVRAALGRAASAQVLFRSGEALERLASVGAIRFDKTGTLTTGEPSLLGIAVEREEDRKNVIRHARALANSSTHVLSRAILRSTSLKGGDRETVDRQVRAIPGLGVEAIAEAGVSPKAIYLGNRRLLGEHRIRIGPTLKAATRVAEDEGRSLAWVAWDGRARGLFSFRERLRAEAKEAIARCQGLGIDVAVLTGDHRPRGEALARELGVPVEAALLPEAKAGWIRAEQKRFGRVAMVGDGVNDAPALAVSDLGIALGCGTDLSRDTAGVCLLGDDLGRLPWAIELARRTVTIIRGNLAWAFGYNAIGVGLAATGWLNPAIASFLMVGSSAFVIVNSLRLNRDDEAVERSVEDGGAGIEDPASVFSEIDA